MFSRSGRCRRWGLGLTLSCLVGCKGLCGPHGVPEDPLFFNRKPHESIAVHAPPVLLSQADPLPPANPYYAEGRPAYAGGEPARPVPGLLTGRSATPPGAAAPDE